MIPKTMSAKHSRTGATQVPCLTPRGYCCTKGGNTKDCQRFVHSFAEVYDLLRDGYLLRMSEGGKGRGNSRALKSIEFTF